MVSLHLNFNKPIILKMGVNMFDKKKKKKKTQKTDVMNNVELHEMDHYYRIYPKYSDTSTPYHICTKIWTSTTHYPMLCLKIAGWMANSVDPDEMPRSAASHLGLYFLLRPVCPNIYGKYGMIILSIHHENMPI